MKVLVSDQLSEVGVKIFQETPDLDVDVNTGLAPEQLKEIIGQYHGLHIDCDVIKRHNDKRTHSD